MTFSSNRTLIALGAAAALGLAACGGSSHQPTTTNTAAIASVTSASSTTAAHTSTTAARTSTTPTTAAKSSTTAAKPNVAKAHPKYGPAVGTNQGGTAKVITRIQQPLPPGVTPAKSHSISACLTAAGLAKASMIRSGVWSAADPVTRKSVSVDGPYQNAGSANESVKTLRGITLAARGGLFVVSAALTSHLEPAVRSVAACLGGSSGSGGSGSLHF